LHSKFGGSDMPNPYDIGTDFNNNLSQAISSIQSEHAILNVNTGVTIGSSITVPSNIQVNVNKGGLFTKTSSGSITFNGPFTAGLYQVFSGFSEGGIKFGEGTVTNVFPQWWGAVGDGATNDFDAVNCALQAAADASATLLLTKLFAVNSSLSVVASKFTIRGANKRSTGLTSAEEIDILTIGNDDEPDEHDDVPSRTDITLENIAIGFADEDYTAPTLGLKIYNADRLRMHDVTVTHIQGGYGMQLLGVWDAEIIGCMFLRNGKTDGQKANVYIGASQGREANSIDFIGCTFERGYWHQVETYLGAAIHFTGRSKFHGRTPDDDDNDALADGLHSEGTSRLSVVGCQFTSTQRYGIYAGASGDTVGSLLAVGNTFNDPRNAAGSPNPAYNIYVDAGKPIIDDNNFFFGNDDSYSINGADIYLSSSVLRAVGTNAHNTSAVKIIDNRPTDATGMANRVKCAGADMASNSYRTIDAEDLTGTTAQTTLKSYTVKGRMLSTWRGIRIKALGENSGAGGTKTITLKWGTEAYVVHPAANNANGWKLEADILQTGGSASQALEWRFYSGAQGGTPTVTMGWSTSAAQDTSADTVVSIKGTLANGGDHIYLYKFEVEFY
jgi:hypothetical protein